MRTKEICQELFSSIQRMVQAEQDVNYMHS